MNIIVDKKRLNNLLNDFYNCTGLSISFFDTNYNFITGSSEQVEYCTEIRSTDAGLSQCNLSDITYFKKTEEEKKTVFYTCNAGVTETITPVFYESKIIGFIIVGRFIDKEGEFADRSAIEKCAKKLGLSLENIERKYDKLPVVDRKKLQSVIAILDICIKSIWRDGLIKVNNGNLMDNIEEYIDKNIREKLTLSSVCGKFYISKNTMYALFKNTYNLTYGNYIIKKRIELAKNLLTSSNYTITDVADRVGFRDYNYFISAFKKWTNETPLNFRKKFKV